MTLDQHALDAAVDAWRAEHAPRPIVDRRPPRSNVQRERGAVAAAIVAYLEQSPPCTSAERVIQAAIDMRDAIGPYSWAIAVVAFDAALAAHHVKHDVEIFR